MRAAKRNLFGRAVWMLLAAGAVSAAASGQTTQPAGPVGVSAAQAAIEVDPATGRVVSIRVAGDEMAQAHPAGSDRPIGFLEVEDLREGRTYNPIKVRSTISDWQTVGQGAEQGIRFRQQYDSARFSVQHTLRPTPAGVRWEASLRLAAGEELNRSVVVSWMLPLPFGWRFWGPNDTVSYATDGVTPYRFVYAHTDHRPYATILPLVGAWGRKGGAAVFSPPDVRKCQITFDVATQRISDPGKGVHRRAEDLQMLRVAHHAVGLRPGKELRRRLLRRRQDLRAEIAP
jgi:hypothetical protein